jgi:hypothetical protein
VSSAWFDALPRGQLPGRILLDEIRERDDDLDGKNSDDEARPGAARLRPAKGEKQHGVEEVAHRMKRKLATLPWPPGKPLGQLVMIDGVECSHGDLHEDERPQRRGHGSTSRKTAC